MTYSYIEKYPKIHQLNITEIIKKISQKACKRYQHFSKERKNKK